MRTTPWLDAELDHTMVSGGHTMDSDRGMNTPRLSDYTKVVRPWYGPHGRPWSPDHDQPMEPSAHAMLVRSGRRQTIPWRGPPRRHGTRAASAGPYNIG